MAGHFAIVYSSHNLTSDGQGEIALTPNAFGRVVNAYAGLRPDERKAADEAARLVTSACDEQDVEASLKALAAADAVLKAKFDNVELTYREPTHSLNYAGFPPTR